MFYIQAKAKRVQHQKNSLTRNVKGNSLSKKGKPTTRNTNSTKGKISLVKENIQ